jgi:type IV secretory pathway VirB2 component (pilin)
MRPIRPSSWKQVKSRLWKSGLLLSSTLALARGALAQGNSPWENAVNVLQTAFTGPIAKGLALVAIVVGGLTFAFGEGGGKKTFAGIVFGLGMAVLAVNFLTTMQTNPVFRSLNRPLTILGAERKLFFFALVMGACVFNLLNSLAGAMGMFFALYLFARWATRTDPQILRFLLNSTKIRTQYDPMKFEPVQVRRLRRV